MWSGLSVFSDWLAVKAGDWQRVVAQNTSLRASWIVAKTADGKLWFLPIDGVSVVDTLHLPFNKLAPPVHVEQITADRKTYDASFDVISGVKGDAKGHLRLPPLVRDLEIDYTALSLVAPEKVFFRYKLEGWERDWPDAGNRRQTFYTNLSPGRYRFRVTACNNSGMWNETGHSRIFPSLLPTTRRIGSACRGWPL